MGVTRFLDPSRHALAGGRLPVLAPVLVAAGLLAAPAAAAPLVWAYEGAPLTLTPLGAEICAVEGCEDVPARYTAWLSVDPALIPGGNLAGLAYQASTAEGLGRNQTLTTDLGTLTQSCDYFVCTLDLPAFLDFDFAGFTPESLNADTTGDTAWDVSIAFGEAGAPVSWFFSIGGNYSVCNFGSAISAGGGLCGEEGYDIHSLYVPTHVSAAPGIWTPVPVPLPATALLLAGALGALALRAWRR